ncbi:MAG: cobyric acid synthase [Rhizobiaceae bacterium]|nr:cobyric acid synthase [Rhizobiaceae bacterium]
MARALMFQGTGSDVGKTVLVAGLCRALKKRGLKVMPFKPQNMSNNAAVAQADDGQGEIGRGQWLQALACGVEPSVHMNPVLLKPQSQIGSQVVVQGKVWGNAKAREYLALKPKLMTAVMESYERVNAEADIVLVEGAGSPAEINLREGDIANMGFATEAKVPVVLIGDIDRGGVIASIVGTHTILPDEDRATIAGYLINKFRGDISLFDDGLKLITQFSGWPSFGILPWVDAIKRLPAEDSVALDKLDGALPEGFRIVVPAMGKIANFDDFDPLRAEPGVALQFIRKGDAFPDKVDMVVLPGSKSTIADMIELRENGWEQPIKEFASKGGVVIGVCGGYQMLGKKISDPKGLEGDVPEIEGLGLLNVETDLLPEKTVQTFEPASCEFGCELTGYEIHMGYTDGPDCARAMVNFDGRFDGAINAAGNVRGCYLHGLFGSDAYRKALLKQCGFEADETMSYSASVEQALDELASAMEEHLDIDGLLRLAG